jgi:hypothetical protein
MGWSVKRERVKRGGRYDALALYAPTLHSADTRQSQFVGAASKAPLLFLHERSGGGEPMTLHIGSAGGAGFGRAAIDAAPPLH